MGNGYSCIGSRLVCFQTRLGGDPHPKPFAVNFVPAAIFVVRRWTYPPLAICECPLRAPQADLPQMSLLTQSGMRSICLAINDLGARGRPFCHSLHSRHRGAATDPGPLIGRGLSERVVKSSILERNSLRIGDLFSFL